MAGVKNSGGNISGDFDLDAPEGIAYADSHRRATGIPTS